MGFISIFGTFRNYFSQLDISLAQYGSYLYLQILIAALIPAVILGCLKIRVRFYGVIVSFVMILLLVWLTGAGMKFFTVFFLSEIALIFLYQFIRRKTKNKYIYFLFLFLSMSPLLISKFSGMFTGSVVGFLGLSYLNFKTIQIIIEIYDGSIKKVNLFNLVYFLSFFPTLSSGPIDRYNRFENEIKSKIPVKNYAGDYLANGIRKIIMGIGYKFVMAYLINQYWLTAVPPDKSLLSVISYMYAYSFYLFFDFAGYSNFAIGTSYILAVKTPENFNMPFASKDMKEFWTRWHISLSRWFGDYIYSRIVLNALRNKWVKSKHTAGYAAQIITMFIMGLWHGPQVFYILYGFYQGVLLVGTDYFQRKMPFHRKHKNKPWYEIISVISTFNLVCFGFLIFSGYLF